MNRKTKKRTKSVSYLVSATPERLKMAGGSYDELSEVTSGGMLRKTGAIRLWTPLEDLYRNNRITTAQYEAAEKFYKDWYLGFMASAQVTMRWSDYVSGLSGGDNQSLDVAERKEFHKKRFKAANELLDLCGDIRRPIHWLVINDIKPRDVGMRFRGYRGMDKAQAAGTTTITIGLQALAKFYGIIK